MWTRTEGDSRAYRMWPTEQDAMVNLAFLNYNSEYYEAFVRHPKIRGPSTRDIHEALRAEGSGFRRVAEFDDLEQAKGAAPALYYMQD